jgi:hypothetical protein
MVVGVAALSPAAGGGVKESVFSNQCSVFSRAPLEQSLVTEY